MTFLNGVLLFGAAAFSLPLLIHLLNRSRFRTVPWGAMHLLQSVVRANNRRLRLEQLILLLIRCAIPVLLALCLARPVLTGWQALTGEAPSSVVILLDNSYSMDARQRDQTRLDAALESASVIVEALPRGADVSVLATGGGPAPLLEAPTFDTGRLRRQLRLLRGGYGPNQVAESLQHGLDVVAGMSNVRRDLIVLSDFQRRDWEQLGASTLARIRERCAAMPMVPNITLLPLAEPIEENVSIEALGFPSDLVGVGQQVRLRVRLRNHGARSYPGLKVLLHVDGRRCDTSQIALGPRATAQALFTHQFQQPGSHTVECEVRADDGLSTDNRYTAALRVVDKIPVLLVDGAPSTEPLAGETDFLAVALTPFSLGRVTMTDLLETRSIGAAQLDEEAIRGARVVILANVARLSDEQVEWLAEHVRSGAGLLVFVGDRVNAGWYNRQLVSGPERLLPMPIGPVCGRGKPQAAATRIVAQRFDDPALQLFNDRAHGNLADAEIWNWCRLGYDLSPAVAAAATPHADDDSTHVLARLETSDPFLVQRRVGAGLVVQVATACDADWSNLPMRPFYLPLMQQLVTNLAFQVTPPCNIQTGHPLIATVPGDRQDQPLSLQAPDGTRFAVRAVSRGSNALVQFDRTRQPGIYVLSGAASGPLRVAAETPRDESDLRQLTPQQFQTLAEQLDARVVRSSDQYLQEEQARRYGREVWQLLLVATLGLMFLELFLQQRFARVQT